MAMSGVKVDPEAVERMRLVCSITVADKKNYLGAAFMHFSSCRTKVICDSEDTLPRDCTWKDVTEKMVEMGACYVLCNDQVLIDGDDKLTKPLFICWAPESTKIKDKMLLASTKATVVKQVPCSFKSLEIQDEADLAAADVLKDAKSK